MALQGREPRHGLMEPSFGGREPVAPIKRVRPLRGEGLVKAPGLPGGGIDTPVLLPRKRGG